MKMKISILIPTKNGIHNCNNTIKSILENCSGKHTIEILLKVDIYDENYINDIHKLQYKDNIKIIISKEEYGSGGLHLYLNEMYKICDGDWILPFNDDALILTKNWDILLEEYDYNEPIILRHLRVSGKTAADQADYYFPFISKKYLEITKRLSTFPFYDGYILEISKKCNIRKNVNIQFNHLDTIKSRLNGEQIFDYIPKNEYKNDIEDDIKKIKEYLKNNE